MKSLISAAISAILGVSQLLNYTVPSHNIEAVIDPSSELHV